MSARQIQIQGVSKTDYLMFKKEPGSEHLNFKFDGRSGQHHGDLGLGVITVVLTLATLKIVGMILLRKHESDEWTETTIEIKDGVRTERTIRYKWNKSEAPEDTVIKAIGEALAIDLGAMKS